MKSAAQIVHFMSGTYHRRIDRTLRLLSLFLILLGPKAFGEESQTNQSIKREIWRGTFVQKAPMPWSGGCELYIRFNDEAGLPTPLVGVITWAELGGAKTKVAGQVKSLTQFEFVESSCLSGDCSKLVLGGLYYAETDTARTRLEGKAEGPLGLRGTFQLERVMPELPKQSP